MSAPVYVGKHSTEHFNVKGLTVGDVVDRMKRRGVIPDAQRCDCRTCRSVRGQQRPEPRHYKPCPNCDDTGLRVETKRFVGNFPTAQMQTWVVCGCGAPAPITFRASDLPLADLAQRDGVVGGLLADRPGGVPQPPGGVHHHTPKDGQR